MSKQIFNRKTLFTKTCVDNILEIFDIEGDVETNNWYLEANRFAGSLSAEFNVPMLKVCGIIAALSPLKNWDENKRIAESFLRTGNGYHTKTFIGKAERIYDGSGDQVEIAEILHGNKITSFFLNIAFPLNASIVTIDRHAQDILLGKICEEDKRNMTTKQYAFFVNCYTIAANLRAVTPSTMQAITWVKWRELKKQDDFQDVPF